jgi:hypothetical protein
MPKTFQGLFAACLGLSSLGQAKTLSQQHLSNPRMLSQQVDGYYHNDKNVNEEDISF